MKISGRKLALGAFVIAMVVAAWWTLDALVVTEAERLERIVELITVPMTDEVVTEWLTWVDPSIQPVEIIAVSASRRYDASNAPRFAIEARGALGPYMGTSARAIRRAVRIEDDRATVTAQLVGDRGMGRIEVRLVRHGERWLADRVRVAR